MHACCRLYCATLPLPLARLHQSLVSCGETVKHETVRLHCVNFIHVIASKKMIIYAKLQRRLCSLVNTVAVATDRC